MSGISPGASSLRMLPRHPICWSGPCGPERCDCRPSSRRSPGLATEGPARFGLSYPDPHQPAQSGGNSKCARIFHSELIFLVSTGYSKKLVHFSSEHHDYFQIILPFSIIISPLHKSFFPSEYHPPNRLPPLLELSL